MKLAWRLFSLAAACLLLAVAAVAQMKEATAAEREVWQLEEDYWKYAQAYDLESYRTLWHDQFVGWPRSEPAPVGKGGIGGWLERRRATGHSLRYKLERRAVRQIEGAVVAHYTVHVEWVAKDGKAESEVSRITHTWVKSGSRWKIITGMSAPIEKPVAK